MKKLLKRSKEIVGDYKLQLNSCVIIQLPNGDELTLTSIDEEHYCSVAIRRHSQTSDITAIKDELTDHSTFIVHNRGFELYEKRGKRTVIEAKLFVDK